MYFIKFVCLFCLEKVSAVYLCHMVIILYLFNSENMYKSPIYRVHRVFIAHFVCVKVRFLGSEWTAKLSMFGTPKKLLCVSVVPALARHLLCSHLLVTPAQTSVEFSPAQRVHPEV